MAHQLMPVTVHQALHGYSDGHRLISSSMPLPSADARVMLVMSDLSGPGVRPDPTGYLTGYPLEGIGKYVLARTWAAPEMSRPGCVWTHSLIIDNADLAALKTAGGLLRAFQRPPGAAISTSYVAPIEISEPSAMASRVDGNRIRTIANALYTAPERPVIAETDEPDQDDSLVVTIWMQQWPRLRRTFGFCTLSGIDRSSKGAILDLQLVRAVDRQLRSKFPNAITPPEAPLSDALDTLTADLSGRDHTQIREFLRRAGGDVDGGRRAMLPLCRLHAALFETSPPNLSGAVTALAALDQLGSRQARSVRSLVARRAIEDPDKLDDVVFDFLLETLDQAGLPERSVLGAHFGNALWQRSPARFMDAIAQDGVVGQACAQALKLMPIGPLLAGFRRDAGVVTPIVMARPDVLEQADFWQMRDANEELAFGAPDGAAARVAGALAAAGRIGPAAVHLIEQADPGDLIATLEGGAADFSILSAWLQALAKHPDRAAAALASGRAQRLSTLAAIARASEPDSIPNDYGEDPWIIAARKASGLITEVEFDYLAAFLMSRALGSRSRSRAELFRFTYGRVYRALEQSRLPSNAEILVTWRLDRGWLHYWDNCARLRDTVTYTFIDLHLDPEIFGYLVDEGSLALALIDEAARTGRGRRYLAEVRQKLASSSDPGMRARADHITKRIK